ncbi:MAG: hypothetical protein M5U19_22000 [Microthrixaceae bacterium]|nr:hypothetical protein [Microthrixaceae bacterium]
MDLRPYPAVRDRVDGARRGPPPGWLVPPGVGSSSREEVDDLLRRASVAGHDVQGPFDDGPPVGYWGLIVDPDGHNLEVAYGQEVGFTVEHAG